MEPKHSDDYFRDKLAGFEQDPPPHVWDRVRHSLDKKRSRRLVPLWWSLGGIAAVFLIALMFSVPDIENATDIESDPALPGLTEPAIAAPTQREDITGDAPDGTTPESEIQDSEIQNSVIQGSEIRNNEIQDVNSTRANGVATTQDGLRTRDPENDRPMNSAGLENRAVAANEGRNSTESPVLKASDTEAEGDFRNPDAPSKGQESNDLAEVVPERMSDQEQTQEADTPAAGKSLLDAIAGTSDEEDIPETTQGPRWSVGTNVAPVFFNSFGSGSPIAPNFVANSKSGTVNLSFGFSVAYDVSSRLSIRSGINKVDFGYNTNEVAFTPMLDAGSTSLIRTINYSESGKNVVVQSTAQANPVMPDMEAADVTAASPSREGRMLQEFGYLEVPLEMAYRLVDRKLGVNLVGGMSSLFLVDNSVSLSASGGTTELGEATNMNSVSFSTNVGLGLYYNLSRDLQIEVQPIFKYHLNTFSETAGSFNPYSIGVYSGIRYRF